jgi:hypothetical protein
MTRYLALFALAATAAFLTVLYALARWMGDVMDTVTN